MIDPGTTGSGWRVRVLDSVASTMDEARRLAAEGVPDRTVVRALEQTGGRGRMGRRWASPRGNVYATAVLRPQIGPVRASELSLVAAVSVADAVAVFAGPVRLKWPNDVLIGDVPAGNVPVAGGKVAGGKVAGVLLEAVTEGAALTAVLVGVGINVASRPDLPDRPTARIASATAEAVFEQLLAALDARVRQWARDGLGPARAAWMERGPPLGTPLAVGQGGEPVRGTFAGLEPGGALRLTLADGSLRLIASGEVLA